MPDSALNTLQQWLRNPACLDSFDAVEALRAQMLDEQDMSHVPQAWWEYAEPDTPGGVYRRSGEALAERYNLVGVQALAENTGVNAASVWTRIRRANVPVRTIQWGGHELAYVAADQAQWLVGGLPRLQTTTATRKDHQSND
jgi:hypothetical protein